MQKNKLSTRFKLEDKKLEKVVEEQKDFIQPKIIQSEEIHIEISDLKKILFDKINSIPVWHEYSIEKQKQLVESFLENKKITGDEKSELVERLSKLVSGYGPIQNLLDNENVSAVFINGTKSIFIMIDGRVLNTEIKLDKNELQYLTKFYCPEKYQDEIFTYKDNRYATTFIKSGMCDNNVNIFIHKIQTFELKNLIDNGTLSQELADFLTAQILNKKRIIISGDINSGKSTILNALINSSLKDKRCFIFENSSEISGDSDYWTKFDVSRCDYNLLLPSVLKSLPEYVIADLNVPEEEFLVSTMRSSSIKDAFRDLVGKYGNMTEKYAKLKVLSDFDYIVHVDKYKIVSVAELKPEKTMAQSINIIFEC